MPVIGSIQTGNFSNAARAQIEREQMELAWEQFQERKSQNDFTKKMSVINTIIQGAGVVAGGVGGIVDANLSQQALNLTATSPGQTGAVTASQQAEMDFAKSEGALGRESSERIAEIRGKYGSININPLLKTFNLPSEGPNPEGLIPPSEGLFETKRRFGEAKTVPELNEMGKVEQQLYRGVVGGERIQSEVVDPSLRGAGQNLYNRNIDPNLSGREQALDAGTAIEEIPGLDQNEGYQKAINPGFFPTLGRAARFMLDPYGIGGYGPQRAARNKNINMAELAQQRDMILSLVKTGKISQEQADAFLNEINEKMLGGRL